MGITASGIVIAGLVILLMTSCLCWVAIIWPGKKRHEYKKYHAYVILYVSSLLSICIVLSVIVYNNEYDKGRAIKYSDLEKGAVFVVLVEADKEFLNKDVPDENLKIYLTIMAEGGNVARLLCAGNGMEYYETLVLLKNNERFSATDRGPKKI